MDLWKIDVTKEYRLIEAVAFAAGSKKKAKKLIDEGLVSVSGVKELRYRQTVKRGKVVELCLNPFLFKTGKPELLYNKNGVLVVNKLPFINSNVDKPNLEELLRKTYGKGLRVVHRLDKQTSGVLIAVESGELFEKFKELFRKKLIKKEYMVIVPSAPKWERRRIEFRLDGKEAVTEITVLERFRRGALLLAKIPTGRKHQIRRHLSQIGLPVAGEFLYYRGPYRFPFTLSPRILLHSYGLEFKHPVSGENVRVKAPLPGDFREFLESLKKFRFNVRELTL